MAKKATIQELYEKIVTCFRNVSNLTALYVGKTQNEKSAQMRHGKEYDRTRIIAFGKPNIIKRCEDYFIINLKHDFPNLIENEKEGSAGNPGADMLYISWVIEYNDINQLEEPELFEEPFELIGE